MLKLLDAEPQLLSQLQGLRVAVIAPSGIPDSQRLQQGLQTLRELGMVIHEGKALHDQFHYFAGTHEARIRDFIWALTAPDLDVVWLARGGYGCAYCLPHIPAKITSPRTLIGFSDTTALFRGLQNQPNMRLIHGPGVVNLSSEGSQENLQWVLATLVHQQAASFTLRSLANPAQGVISGQLDGGNIIVTASLVGTPWQLDATERILILEDVTEQAYRIDRALLQLRLAGNLDGAKAIVLGDFTQCPVPKGADYNLSEIILDVLAPLGIPILDGLPSGHDTRNLAWEYGKHARIEQNLLSWDC